MVSTGTAPAEGDPAAEATTAPVAVIAARRPRSATGVPHAIPYQGSKRFLAPVIVRLIPAGTSRLLEPFAGSAAVSIAARFTDRVLHTEIGDINGPLMDLWRSLLTDPADLATGYERLWREQVSDPRTYYEAVRALFNASPHPHRMLYLLARCVKAAVRYSKSGNFNQSADNRRLGAKPDTMMRRIFATSSALAGSQESYWKFVLKKYRPIVALNDVR